MEPAVDFRSHRTLGAADEIARRFVLHRPRIVRYLQGAVNDAHAAEDLAQETLVRGLTYAHGLREPAAAAAWLLRIAWHVALDFHRRRVRARIEPTEDGRIDAESCVREATPAEQREERAIRELWRGRLRSALAGLRDLDRVLIIGHYFVGLSCAELSRRSGISRDTVKMRLCRARRRLRRVLADPWKTEPRPWRVARCDDARAAARTPRAEQRTARATGCYRAPPLGAAATGGAQPMA